MSPSLIGWRDDVVAAFDEVWKTRVSASKIAASLTERFGMTFTKNMVIGYSWRSGKKIPFGGKVVPIKRKPASNLWTPEQDDILRAMTADSAPREQIALRLGRTKLAVEKRAVILGVRLWSAAEHKWKSQKREAENKCEITQNVPAVAIPETRRVTLLDLTPRSCRWPLGDPRDEDFHFCGEQAPIGGVYCDFHKALSLDTPEARAARRKSYEEFLAGQRASA